MKKVTSLKLRYKTYSIAALIIFLTLPISNFLLCNLLINDFSDKPKTQAEDSGEDSIIWKLGKGFPGSGAAMQPRLVNLTGGGPPLIIVGTDGGIATITLDGFIYMSYRTFGPVIDFEIIEDISGDNQDDIVLITYYQEHPNLIAISSNNGSELWKFKPIIEGISPETYQAQNFIPYSWDIKLINDITSDFISEIVISSWHRLIAVNGKSGNKVWMNDQDFTNDVWKIEVVEDINGNGFETIIAGSEEGKLSAFDSRDGNKLWTFTVEGMQMLVYSMTGLTLQTIPNSIDDIRVVGDVNNDEINDIIMASDDGILRLISGRYGRLLDDDVCYNLSSSTESYYGSYPTSPYSSVKRIFMKSGIKIYEIPDINNDGIKEYISIASDLDYSYDYGSQDKIIQGKIFNINPLTEINKINITRSLNWTYNSFFLSSYPEIVKIDSDIYIYYYSYETTGYSSQNTALINRYHIDDDRSLNPEVVYTDPGQYEYVSQYSGSKKGHYFLNVGDLNSDGVDDLFAITANGRYLCIDSKNNDILWVRSQEESEIEITETNDLNDDGFKDFLIKQKSDFEPDWIISGTSPQTTEKPTIIVELYTIDARTGNIIWSLNIPLPKYYKGLRDLKNVGDITDDDIDDYGAWIIPSIVPSEISEIIKNRLGNGTIDSNKAEMIFRSFLANYTKVLVIDGSDGNIIWNTPMIDFPYKFYRQYEYSGIYLDPVEIQSSGNHIYNRINGEINNTWVSNFDIQWTSPWNPLSLAQASSIVPMNGTSSDILTDLLSDEGNYTINAEYVDSSWKAIMDLTIPVNLLDDNLLGAMEYPLSQTERLSALKMQTSLMVNTSYSNWYNFTYEIFDVTNNKWVLCNWSSGTTTWNNHTYRDLKGNYIHPSLNNSFQNDQMWVITRGTHDADDFIEFDYENKTALSNFVDINKNIQIRLNITNGNSAFNLTINDFGLAAFYWGLFNNEYDRFYIWNEDDDDFDLSNLLNLEIQDFEVVNGTNDQYLDLIAIIGIESYDTPNTWSTRICLFDLKNNEAYTKWSLNQTFIPYQNVRVLPLNNSLNNWLLTGIFQFGSNFNCSHKLISEPYWESQLSYFESYSDSKVLINYSWEVIPTFPIEEYFGSTPYEYPGKTNISKDGKIGIIVGDYKYLEIVHDDYYEEQWVESISSLINIRIIDINSRSTISKIPTENLESSTYGANSNVGKIDFSVEGAGYLLLISHEDFNGDDFLDHVGIYSIYEFSEYYYMYGMECKIFSGNSGDSNPDILFKEYFADSNINYDIYESDKLKMLFTSIGDINNDGTSEAIIGIQSDSYDCKHSYLNFYDIFNSDENEPLELTNYKWTLEPASCVQSYYPYYNYEFVLNIERIEDITGDGLNEIFIEHDYYRKTTDQWGYGSYVKIPASEILDIFDRTILYRFNMDINSIYPIVDLNEDGNRELLIASDDILYCINSKFNIQISNPIDREAMISNNFNIEWETDSQYDYFEVLINGVSQGPTNAKNVQVSLSSGWKDISVIMHDKSGLILDVNTIKVLVPSNQTHLILTIVFLGALIGVSIYYRRYSKKQKELILIDRKISEGGKK